MDCITDHKKGGRAIEMADMYVTTNRRRSIKKSTVGWRLCVLWKDGTTSWERLSDLKESNPVEAAEYATAQGIDHEPAFV